MLARLSYLSLALVLAACGSETATDTALDRAADTAPTQTDRTQADTSETETTITASAGPRVASAETREIDWDAAREDLSGASSDLVTIQSLGEEPAEVPVLLPTGIATSQSAGGGPVFRRTDDGYFAYYPGAAYNITVNGTNQVIPTEAIEDTNPDKEPKYTTTIAGAQVWLTRYGADYVVEFECNDLEDETDICIQEDEALEIANQLIVVGSQ